MADLINLTRILVGASDSSVLDLQGAAPGFRGVEALVDGNTYSYSIQQGSDWEFGTGTYVALTTQFVRSPIMSSNGNAPIVVQSNALLNFVALAEDYPGPPGSPGPPGTSDGKTVVKALSTDTTLDLTYFGCIARVNASGGPVTLTYPIALGSSLASYLIIVERSPSDPTTNPIIIQDDSLNERGRIISPVAGGQVPFLTAYSDGVAVVCRGTP